jgi:hypothetical protein
MESEGSLPCSQETATGPYFESDESSPYHPILFPLAFHLRLGLPSGIFPFGFPTKILHIRHLSHAYYIPYSSHPP